MRLIFIIIFALSVGTHDECADALHRCVAHSNSERERRACRNQYLRCARAIGNE